jgi:hypothetical protein
MLWDEQFHFIRGDFTLSVTAAAENRATKEAKYMRH